VIFFFLVRLYRDFIESRTHHTKKAHFKTGWQNLESPTNCMPLIPRDMERDHVLAESLDVKEVWDSSENMEST
jgi:hypothetical protein